jgi:hypothetical protein
MKRYHQELERTKRVHPLPLHGLHRWPMAPVDGVCEFPAGDAFVSRKPSIVAGRAVFSVILEKYVVWGQ